MSREQRPAWRLSPSCNRALHGWPHFYGDGRPVTPCVGYIESDYAPGTYYPCADCNPNWSRVSASVVSPLPRRSQGT